jgi:hypothetical protein
MADSSKLSRALELKDREYEWEKKKDEQEREYKRQQAQEKEKIINQRYVLETLVRPDNGQFAAELLKLFESRKFLYDSWEIGNSAKIYEKNMWECSTKVAFFESQTWAFGYGNVRFTTSVSFTKKKYFFAIRIRNRETKWLPPFVKLIKWLGGHIFYENYKMPKRVYDHDIYHFNTRSEFDSFLIDKFIPLLKPKSQDGGAIR